jgi:hypothetical protein
MTGLIANPNTAKRGSRTGRSPVLQDSVCNRGSVRTSGPRRGQEEAGSAPVHLRLLGKALRRFAYVTPANQFPMGVTKTAADKHLKSRRGAASAEIRARSIATVDVYNEIQTGRRSHARLRKLQPGRADTRSIGPRDCFTFELGGASFRGLAFRSGRPKIIRTYFHLRWTIDPPKYRANPNRL